jgi:hypothetical protein
MIYPGHGPETTLGCIKAENKELLDFIANKDIK